MAYNLRRFVEYTDREDVVQRAELLELDYSGPSAEILTSDGIQFEHEELTTSGRVYKLYENPILKGTLDLNLIIETAADEQLIQDIVDSDEDQFRIVWKQDGVKFWEGTLLNDLIEYSELPLQAKQPVPITAKDLSSLEANDYAFANDGRGKIIEIIAEILNTLGYGNNIVSVTSWTSASVTQSDDFLNTHYIDRFPLQDYARTGNETNEPLTNWEALQKICQDFKLILKQLDGVWFLVQYSAYEDPSSVREFVYNSDGIQQSATTVNAVGNGSTIIKGKSRTNPYPGLKSARVSYKHRLKSTNIQFPDLIELDPVNNLQQSFTQLFISDGGQSVRLSGLAQAETADTISEFALYFVYVIEAGGYYWDAVNQVWTTSFVSNEEDMVDTYSTGGKLGWERSFNINTTTAPAAADGDLIVTLYIARNDTDGVADYTDFINLNIKIIGAQADENSEYIDYELVQAGAYSTKMELPDAYYGDGPTSFARSAISTDAAGTQFTADQWRRRGQALSLNFHHNSLKEVIDPQRSGIKRSEAQTEGLYNPRLITPYRGSNYIYVGGIYNGDTWEPVLAEVKIQTASDNFSDLPKFVDAALSSDPGGSTAGTPSSGITQDEADARYILNSDTITDAQHGDRGGGSLHSVATSSVSGFMSPSDKQKLDGVAAGADNYGHWQVQIGSTAPDEIFGTDILKFEAGSGATLSYDDVTKTVTIGQASVTDSYLSAVTQAGTIGDDITLEFQLSDGSSFTQRIDNWITPYLDTRYLQSAPVTSVNGKTGVITLNASDVGADNYNHWKVSVDSGIHEEIESGQGVDFIGGTNINLGFDLSGPTPKITINGTGAGANNYLTNVLFAGTLGDDIILRYERAGLSDIDLDMTAHMEAYFDTVYASDSHGHGFSAITGTITNSQHGSRGGGNLHASATTSTAGFMSSSDKSKLNGIESGANNYSFFIGVNGGATTEISDAESIDIIEGTGINISRSGNQITIGNTVSNSNNFVDSFTLGGVSGDDITLVLGRSGLGDLSLDIKGRVTAYLDTVYASVSHDHNNATTSADGFMSSSDKSKLNGIESGANNYSFFLGVNGGATTQISDAESIDIIGGSGINITRSGNQITIENTISNSNNFVNSFGFGGTNGDDITLVLGRSGLSDLSLDITSRVTAYLDTVYANISHSHSNYVSTSGDEMTGQLTIGGSSRISNLDGVEFSGSTSSASLGVQDGNGRIQLKWNATEGTDEKYLISSEPAFFWDLSIMDDPIWEMKYSPAGTAGDDINWYTLLSLTDDGKLNAKDGFEWDGVSLDSRYNNYSFFLGVNGGATTEISDAESIDFVEGSGIDISRSGNQITIASTVSSSNNFVNSLGVGGTAGADVTLVLGRSGLSDLSFNLAPRMTAFLDTQYASLTHSHGHFTNFNNPHNVTKNTIGLAQVINAEQVPRTGGNFTGNVTMDSELDVIGDTRLGSASISVTTADANILNLMVGSTNNGEKNGITFWENDTFGMALGYDGTGSGAGNKICFYGNDHNAKLTVFNNGNVVAEGSGEFKDGLILPSTWA